MLVLFFGEEVNAYCTFHFTELVPFLSRICVGILELVVSTYFVACICLVDTYLLFLSSNMYFLRIYFAQPVNLKLKFVY